MLDNKPRKDMENFYKYFTDKNKTMDMKNQYKSEEDRLNENKVNLYKKNDTLESIEMLNESNILDLDN